MAPNPYQAPTDLANARPRGAPLGPGGEDCPRCQSFEVKAPSMTWWGGFLGPKLFNHRVCRSCGFGFNAKTRRSNTTAIAIYTAVILSLTILLIYARN